MLVLVMSSHNNWRVFEQGFGKNIDVHMMTEFKKLPLSVKKAMYKMTREISKENLPPKNGTGKTIAKKRKGNTTNNATRQSKKSWLW